MHVVHYEGYLPAHSFCGHSSSGSFTIKMGQQLDVLWPNEIWVVHTLAVHCSTWASGHSWEPSPLLVVHIWEESGELVHGPNALSVVHYVDGVRVNLARAEPNKGRTLLATSLLHFVWAMHQKGRSLLQWLNFAFRLGRAQKWPCTTKVPLLRIA